jgi:hypothetical protein
VRQEVRPVRRRYGLVFGLIVAGVLLSLINTNAQAELDRRRHAACDGTLPLPTSAYVLGVTGLFVGTIALYLALRWFRHSRQPITLILLATAGAAVVVELLGVVTAFQQGSPVESLCFG